MAKEIENKNEDTDAGTDKAIEADIDTAVETTVKDIEDAREPESGDDDKNKKAVPEEDGVSDGGDTDNGASKNGSDENEDENKDGDKDGDNKPDPDAVTDANLERAVLAGFTMAEARKFGSASLLESTVSQLEAARKDKPEDGDGGTDGDGEDPLAAVPDLDPEVYDENIVAVVKGLKDIVRKQHTEMQELRNQKPSNDDWFDGRMDRLDKPVAAAVEADSAKSKAIRDKFDVLVAGYGAAGQDVNRGDAFKEAVGIVMGDVITQAAIDAKTKALAKREKQHIHRVADGAGKSGEGDMIDDIAADIDKKISQG